MSNKIFDVKAVEAKKTDGYSYLYNVRDKFKSLEKEEIIKHLQETASGFAICMCHVEYDFNIAGVIRAANNFNANEIFYFGTKKFDRRGACGSYHYNPFQYLKTYEEFISLKEKYTFVGFETGGEPLITFDWKKFDKPPMIIIGSENLGIPEEIVKTCEYMVEIPSLGSIRSLNAAVASSIAMYDFIAKK